MTPRLPRIPARKAARALERLGFRLERQSGSHRIYVNGRGTAIPMPFHAGDLKPGLLRRIIRDAGVSVEEFERLL